MAMAGVNLSPNGPGRPAARLARPGAVAGPWSQAISWASPPSTWERRKPSRIAFPNGVVDLAPPPKNSPYDDDAAMALLLGESLLASKGFDETTSRGAG